MKEKLGVLILLVWALIIPIPHLWNICWKAYQLSTKGVSTQGIVIDYQSNNHDQIIYRFEVAGVSYQGAASGASQRMAGTPISILYLPNNPKNSCLAYPERQNQNNLISSLIFLLLFLGILFFALFRRIYYPPND